MSIKPQRSKVERAGASDSFLRLLFPTRLPSPVLHLIEDLCGAVEGPRRLEEAEPAADALPAYYPLKRRLRASARKEKRFYFYIGDDVSPPYEEMFPRIPDWPPEDEEEPPW